MTRVTASESMFFNYTHPKTVHSDKQPVLFNAAMKALQSKDKIFMQGNRRWQVSSIPLDDQVDVYPEIEP